MIDEPDRPWHPYRYVTPCPECGEDAEQAHWEVNLYKAKANATGPKTPEGIAAVTKNIEGHPTPEEAVRTRFNAVKHGLRANTATYFPAKPGKYASCEGCEFRNGCEEQVACTKKTELYMRHHIAFETRDPTLLTGIRATLQANISAIIDDIVLSIIQDGVSLKTPEWYYDRDGGFHLAEYHDTDGEKQLIMKVTAHPLLKTLGELISKNDMTLSSEGMTMRQHDPDLADNENSSGVSGDELRDFQRRNEEQLTGLKKMIQRSSPIIEAEKVDG